MVIMCCRRDDPILRSLGKDKKEQESSNHPLGKHRTCSMSSMGRGVDGSLLIYQRTGAL